MNAYADPLWGGLTRSYIPVSTFQLASTPLGAAARASILKNDVAVSDTHPLLRYFRCDAEGRLIMGGPGSVRRLHEPAQVLHLVECVEQLFPQLQGAYTPEFYWGGNVAVTLDHVPHLHDLGSGVYAYLGCNGRGVALAAAMGMLLARLALGAHKQEIPFRFSELKPVPFHAAHPLYVQALTTYYTLKERFKRPSIPPAVRPSTAGRGEIH
jgi:glycine/D-amino acid oxidase-like deaminating enzyme